jgi:hypothetical protein
MLNELLEQKKNSNPTDRIFSKEVVDSYQKTMLNVREKGRCAWKFVTNAILQDREIAVR